MKTLTAVLITAQLVASAYGALEDGTPFGVSASREASDLKVTLHIADGHFLYENAVAIHLDDSIGAVLKQAPKAKQKTDPFLGETVKVFAQDSVYVYSISETAPTSFSLTVDYQGCSETLCFPPTTVTLSVGDVAGRESPVTGEEAVEQTAAIASWRPLADRFRISARETGYLKTEDFLRFLDSAGEAGSEIKTDKLEGLLRSKGLWAVVVAILLGGLLLNLTPCVLPMIPVNLAIIGAGAKAGSKMRGFALGGAYGLGMAVVYGGLGLLVVLTGAKFGALNSSPWFNLAIALVFAVLALAMLDIIPIDFSRFQKGGGPGGSGQGSFVTAFVLGGIAALLAGACVAPVLISVLLLSTNFYASGRVAGLVLPFLLGIGMALPWPFAGAGMSVLPKPGAWMSKVKYLFAALMFGFVIYYGNLAVSLLRAHATTEEKAGWHTSLEEGLAAAEREGKPVFIDMWASWCKNCQKMEKTTFRDKDVESRLEKYVKIRYRAEDLRNAETKAVMDHVGAIGLPTYVVLLPVEQK